EELVIAPVRFLSIGKAGVLAHRPEAAAVHRRLDPPREGELAREAPVLVLVFSGVKGLYRRAGRGFEGRLPLRCPLDRGLVGVFEPIVLRVRHRLYVNAISFRVSRPSWSEHPDQCANGSTAFCVAAAQAEETALGKD